MKFLVATNKRVVVALAPPGRVSPKACLPRPFKIVGKCQQPLQDALADDRGSRAILKRLLAQFPQVKVYDPYSYLCDATTCKVAVDRKILYIDGGHMSSPGGEYLAEKSHSDLEKLFLK